MRPNISGEIARQVKSLHYEITGEEANSFETALETLIEAAEENKSEEAETAITTEKVVIELKN